MKPKALLKKVGQTLFGIVLVLSFLSFTDPDFSKPFWNNIGYNWDSLNEIKINITSSISDSDKIDNRKFSAPISNSETFPSSTLFIPMDNNEQAVNGEFNLRVYGLIVTLLHNDIPLKWAIRSGKSKDDIDFSASSKRIAPTTNTIQNRNFKGGPIIIWLGYESQAMTVINNFGNNVKIYEL